MTDQPIAHYQLILDTLPHFILMCLIWWGAAACNLCMIVAIITATCRLDERFAFLIHRCTKVIGYAIVEIGYFVAYQEVIDLRPLSKLR